jgi:hypothetical protein
MALSTLRKNKEYSKGKIKHSILIVKFIFYQIILKGYLKDLRKSR